MMGNWWWADPRPDPLLGRFFLVPTWRDSQALTIAEMPSKRALLAQQDSGKLTLLMLLRASRSANRETHISRFSQSWWHRPAITEFRRLRLENHKFELA